MKKSEKNIDRENLAEKSVKKWACPVKFADYLTGVEMKFCEADPFRDFIGVETKNCLFKIGVILARWTY